MIRLYHIKRTNNRQILTSARRRISKSLLYYSLFPNLVRFYGYAWLYLFEWADPRSRTVTGAGEGLPCIGC